MPFAKLSSNAVVLGLSPRIRTGANVDSASAAFSAALSVDVVEPVGWNPCSARELGDRGTRALVLRQQGLDLFGKVGRGRGGRCVGVIHPGKVPGAWPTRYMASPDT